MSIKGKTSKDIEYGDVDLDFPDEKPSRDVKVRITTFVDEDFLQKLKADAATQSKKYQSYLNEKLREVLFGEDSVETRLKKLERAVFKKRA